MNHARVLLVGAGAVSQVFYLPLFARGIDGLRLAGIVDPNPPAAGLPQGVPVYLQSFEQVLADTKVMAQIDAVLVALPHHLHARCVEAVLAQGKHVFCEKPLALSQPELDAIAAADPNGSRVLAVCQPRRHFAAAAAIAIMVKSGVLGRPLAVFWNEGQPYSWPAASISQILAEQGGSELFDIGAHVFDLLSWWFGPLDVVDYSDDSAGGTAAEFSVELRNGNGLPLRVQLSRLHRLDNICEVRFERGLLRWRLASPAGVEILGGDLEPLGLTKLLPVSEAPADMFGAIAEDLRLFGSAIAGSTHQGAGLQDARFVARIFDACRVLAGALRRQAPEGAGPGYLVTGAGGFIGCSLVEALVARGEPVHALVHTPKNSVRLARLGVPMTKADILDGASFAPHIPRNGVVLHCAVSHASPRTSVVDGTMAVLRAAHLGGARRVVVLSSMLAMGDPPPEGNVSESTPLPRSVMAYAAAKAEMENAALRFGRTNGLEVVILRPTCVFGPYGSDFGSVHLDAMAAQTYFYVEQGRGRANLVYVDNLVDAILLAATVPGIAGECFLVNEEEHETTWGEYFSDLANAAFGRETDCPSFSQVEIGELKKEWSRRNRFPGVLRQAVRAHPAAREWLAESPLFRAWQALRRIGHTAEAPDAIAQDAGSSAASKPVVDRKALLRERLVGDRRFYYDGSYAAFFSSRAVYGSSELRRRLGWAPRVGREEAMEATRKWARLAYAQIQVSP